MNKPEIQKVCVVGGGFMGSQIGLQCAMFGRAVSICDTSQAVQAPSRALQEQLLDDQVAAGALAAGDKAVILARIARTTSLEDAADQACLAIEAVTEDLEAKRQVFASLDRLLPPHAIIATNSSSLCVSQIESATGRPDRVLNTHFVQPIWKHNFVELMRGTATTDQTVQAVRDFMKSINVMPIMVRREHMGFVFNRIWRAMKKEALRTVDRGVATHEDVDRTWMIQMEMPMGPFAHMDRVGLDVVRDIEQVYFEASGDPSDAPPRVLLEKIEKGELGVKTGKGFYTYPNPSWQSPQFLKTTSD